MKNIYFLSVNVWRVCAKVEVFVHMGSFLNYLLTSMIYKLGSEL